MTNSDSLVIFLHGVGSSGADLAALGESWAPTLPRTAFAAPDAPSPFDGGGPGRQWFSVAGVTEANRPDRIVVARPAFDATLRAIVDGHGLAGRLDRVVLVGFSQGSIMALDAIASGRWPVGGVVAHSGRLASPQPLAPSTSTRLLLVHGTADPVIPADQSIAAAKMLAGLGVAADLRLIDGLGHGINAEAATIAGRFIAEVLGS